MKRAIVGGLRFLWSFLLFFAMIAFVITCSFLLFFSSIELSEENVRAIAPAVFFNVIFLAVLFVSVDLVRRKITVERPTEEIQRVLERLMQGDFSARISDAFISGKYGRFKEISQSINLLAAELAGVETLRTDFVANVSHELKTPLAVIQSYGTMLQNPELSVKDRLTYSKAVNDSCRQMASLITNVLKLSKLENQQIFPAITEYDLGEQLCECLLLFEDMWEKKNINIETEIEENVTICSDAELLSLVWNNLISNAIKFTEAGGTVGVSLKSDVDFFKVTVKDTGLGMTPEVGAHIFEKFYQGDTSHATRGNGLGLALVKRVIDIMQGEITVESTTGVGSLFTIKLRRNYHGKA